MVADEPIHLEKKYGSGASCHRPPSVVTSTLFDDDDVFQTVARAMLYRYEAEGLSEREVIEATLVTLEDKRGFLETLDFRTANMYAEGEEPEMESSAIMELVETVRATFGETLKLLWRESITGYDRQSSSRSWTDREMVNEDDNHHYRHPLKTPKNLHSPIRRALSEASCPCDMSCTTKPKSSGRQRRRFFPDFVEPPKCRSRIRLDFKLTIGEQVSSLQLDGQSLPPLTGYVPPSPISARNQMML